MFDSMFKFFHRILEHLAGLHRKDRLIPIHVIPEPVVKDIILTEPLEANCVVSYPDRKLSKRMTDGNNIAGQPFLAGGVERLFENDYLVWMYNISTVAAEFYHPNIGTVKVPSNIGGKYVVVTSLPNVVKIPKHNIDGNDISFLLEDGRRIAIDLIHSDNLSINQNQFIDPKYKTAIGNNYGERGVFWSLSNPPGEDDLKEAYVRMEAFYMDLLQRAGVGTECGFVTFKDTVQKYLDYTISVPNPDPTKRRKEDRVAYHPYTLRAARDRAEVDFQITPAHHAAAEYFKQTSVWHPVLKNKI
jgi:hypothetical protein